jgi:xanthine dehydrogenase accessory factor
VSRNNAPENDPPAGSSGPQWIEELRFAVERGKPCALATLASTKGSVPRQPGAKMIVFAGGLARGTIGGGKFEALVIEDCLAALQTGKVQFKSYTLREGTAASFGAICGGEATVLIEPFLPAATLYLFGAGHCSQALAPLAHGCGFKVVVLEDRAQYLDAFSRADAQVLTQPVRDFLDGHSFRPSDAVVLVNRNYLMDQEALHALLTHPAVGAQLGYIGMIGSQRKVARVYDELLKRGVPAETLKWVHAPIGLDIGADSPAEIAVSILAEILATLRGRPGGPLADGRQPPPSARRDQH